MAGDLKAKLQAAIKGEVVDDAETLAEMSRDTSLFEVTPQLVVYPEDVNDVSELVKKIAALRQVQQAHCKQAQGGASSDLTITARAAGTDMSGGPLTTRIVVNFMKHMNRIG